MQQLLETSINPQIYEQDHHYTTTKVKNPEIVRILRCNRALMKSNTKYEKVIEYEFGKV
jgi:hypothetical protein